jgi:hypothetical protein
LFLVVRFFIVLFYILGTIWKQKTTEPLPQESDVENFVKNLVIGYDLGFGRVETRNGWERLWGHLCQNERDSACTYENRAGVKM